MSLKQELIRILEENRGRSVSGEEIAGALSVSRAAVWKAVQALRQEGYHIEAVKNRGYTLSGDSDRLSEEGIRLHLPERWQDCGIYVLQEVDSTNTFAKRLAAEGFFEKTGKTLALVAANRQTAGKGRLGRSFYSPADTGIYMSLLLRANRRIADFLPITVAASLAVCRAIEDFSQETPRIKWVNDVWLGDRKVCGILTEGIGNFENGMLEAAIVGIGINVSTAEESFPEALRSVAASLGSLRVSRNEMIARVAAELFALTEQLQSPALMEEYRSRSLVLGKEIWWNTPSGRRQGKAVGINDAGNLEVETPEGLTVLNSGEVSIRPLDLPEA